MASAESSPYIWLVQDRPQEEAGGSSGSRWSPLKRRDNDRLERVVAGEESVGPSGTVPVECARYDVDLRDRKLRAVYWDEPERSVLRSLWFHGRGGEAVPYEERDAEEIEAAFQRLRAAQDRRPLLVPVNRGCHDVRFEAVETVPKSLEEKDAESKGLGGYMSSLFNSPEPERRTVVGDASPVINSGLAEPVPGELQYTAMQEPVERKSGEPRMPVWRGWACSPGVEAIDKEDPESELPVHVGCLLFVVHGIGQYHRSERGVKHGESGTKFHEDVGQVRDIALRHLHKRMQEGATIQGRFEFLPLEWFEPIHVDVGIGRTLENVTLPSVPALREFANFAIADMMVYQDDAWRERIHLELQRKMDRLFALFRARTPSYSGEVAIVGHSLGSVVMFDLLQKALPGLGRGLLLDEGGAEAPAPPAAAPAAAEGELKQEEHRGTLTSHAGPVAAGATKPAAAAAPPPAAPAAALAATPAAGSTGPGQPGTRAAQCPVPRCFFSVGSPLGMFMSIRLSHQRRSPARYFQGLDVRWPAGMVGRGWRFFNVFHPDDPIAYRVEPLLNPQYTPMQPRVVPHQGGLRWHHQINQWFRGSSKTWADGSNGQESDGRPLEDVLLVRTARDADGAPPSAMNFLGKEDKSGRPPQSVAVDRLDYALQESAFESMNELLSAINSHFHYWNNEDLHHFIVDQLLECLEGDVTAAAR